MLPIINDARMFKTTPAVSAMTTVIAGVKTAQAECWKNVPDMTQVRPRAIPPTTAKFPADRCKLVELYCIEMNKDHQAGRKRLLRS